MYVCLCLPWACLCLPLLALACLGFACLALSLLAIALRNAFENQSLAFLFSALSFILFFLWVISTNSYYLCDIHDDACLPQALHQVLHTFQESFGFACLVLPWLGLACLCLPWAWLGFALALPWLCLGLPFLALPCLGLPLLALGLPLLAFACLGLPWLCLPCLVFACHTV